MNHDEPADVLHQRIAMLKDAYNKERDRADWAEKILSVIVEDAGGEMFLVLGRVATARPIQLRQDGEGSDDELTITVIYD